MDILAENLFRPDEIIVVLRDQGEFKEGLAFDFVRYVRNHKPSKGLIGQECAFLVSLFPAQIKLDLILFQLPRFPERRGLGSRRSGKLAQSWNRARIRRAVCSRGVGWRNFTRLEPAAACGEHDWERKDARVS